MFSLAITTIWKICYSLQVDRVKHDARRHDIHVYDYSGSTLIIMRNIEQVRNGTPFHNCHKPFRAYFCLYTTEIALHFSHSSSFISHRSLKNSLMEDRVPCTQHRKHHGYCGPGDISSHTISDSYIDLVCLDIPVSTPKRRKSYNICLIYVYYIYAVTWCYISLTLVSTVDEELITFM